MKIALTLLALPLMLAVAPAYAATPAPIAAAIASADRPDADKARDADRKPAELLAFTGVKPGDKVVDIIPGGGYVTRLFAKTVGPKGKVYALVPTEFLARGPRAAEGTKAIVGLPAFSNVTEVDTGLTEMALPEPVDLAWTSENYHDVYNSSGAEASAKFVAGVFKTLKPGGVFIVTDHAATPGTLLDAAKPLHRIDPAIVKAQAKAAGFEFVGESNAIANPADPHDKPVFDPSIRGKTDQFALKFRKPTK